MKREDKCWKCNKRFGIGNKRDIDGLCQMCVYDICHRVPIVGENGEEYEN